MRETSTKLRVRSLSNKKSKENWNIGNNHKIVSENSSILLECNRKFIENRKNKSISLNKKTNRASQKPINRKI